jgi:hypothetical protein
MGKDNQDNLIDLFGMPIHVLAGNGIVATLMISWSPKQCNYANETSGQPVDIAGQYSSKLLAPQKLIALIAE